MRNHTLLFVFIILCFSSVAQTPPIHGTVSANGAFLPMIKIQVKGENRGAYTDSLGNFAITGLKCETCTIAISDFNYAYFEQEVDLTGESIHISIYLEPNPLLVDQVVVTGTRTDKRQTDAPIIVGVINSATLENVQACSLSDGLKFQPGLRVETDCQTCNYTQLRMNGLAGGYSQILINGRPIFSPLTGLYGLEQIPSNMIDRIEVVRGGGSALYGSSAIGGTVNVITKVPRKGSYSVSNNYQFINGKASENIISGNTTLVHKTKSAGVSLFFNNRNRQYYDHNGDNFSEIPELKNTSVGANFFYLPSENQKLELSLSNLNEYRYGGEMVDKPAHLALQSEERMHHVYLGSLDYQINFNEGNSSMILYTAGQYTGRTHYTGLFPDDSSEAQLHLHNPPYGTSSVSTLQGGAQFNHRIDRFLHGENVITIGTEYLYDDVLDEIPTYNYLVDQTTTNLGMFLQSDWEIIHDLTLLVGLRADKHNRLHKFVLSPRAALLFKLKETTQLRLSWGKGFRAPQAFDTDLHIAFSGGGISRITLADNLIEERSNSISASVNYDKVGKNHIAGFTIEGFYTQLKNAFYQHPLGEDEFGEVFEKRNGDGAVVAGTSVEFRANYRKIIEFESGFTYQTSMYTSPVKYSDELLETREFLRTPNVYGFATLFFTPIKQFTTSLNAVYTGKMKLLHFAGAPEQVNDAYFTSPEFIDLSVKSGYTFQLMKIKSELQLFGGVKNIFKAYQNNFDTGKIRDSNFIFGPSLPRTYFIGLKISSL